MKATHLVEHSQKANEKK